MAVYIPGIDMPDDGEEYIIRADGTVRHRMGLGTALVAGVRAVPVPPHGDLIDRNVVMDRTWDMETFADAVKYAPTVIPASVDGE